MARPLPWIVVLAAVMHLIGMSTSILPAQDGLKFIRVARQFHAKPWADVVRGTDQHPLYPATIALTQPAVASILGQGPDSWRIAAQLVSVLASLGMLVVLHCLTRDLFDRRTADLGALIFALLPLPAELGHDTLSDPLALLGFALAFRLGAAALRTRGLAAPLGCGVAAGLGFLTRPEVLVVPIAVLIAAVSRTPRASNKTLPLAKGELEGVCFDRYETAGRGADRGPARFSALAVAFLAMVGSYALVKGEVSEKLALRRGAAIAGQAIPVRKAPLWLPPGLDDPRWDFSAKEESERTERLGFGGSLARVLGRWAECLGWIFAPLALWGFIRVRTSGPSSSARRLAGIYLILFAAILVRHAMTLGYLSGRHALTMAVVSLPWAAAGIRAMARRLIRAKRWSWALLVVLIGVGVTVQNKPGHPSRWGHRSAGRWLAEHSKAADAVLDTRGWAAFVSGRRGYDYWHVRQALTDSTLAYVVVGADELAAKSRRAETLRAVLDYAGTPVADFPERCGGHDVGVRVFRFRRPRSWEGLRP